MSAEHCHRRGAARALTRLVPLVLACGAAAATASATDLFVTTTTFEVSGSCSVVQMEPPFAAACDLYTIHSDAVARRAGRYVFVVNRQPANNILVLDAQNDYAVVKQFGTGNGTNPGDIALVGPTRAYVPLYDKPYLLIVNPFTGQQLGTIDLSVFADADGLPEMDQVAVVQGRAFVSLQRLDRAGGWVPAGGSCLAVIDTATDALVDTDPTTGPVDPIALQLQNPFWQLRWEPALHRLVAVCPGAFLALDGGIEAVHPFTLRSDRVIATEAQLGGEVSAAGFAAGGVGWALVSDAAFNTCLVRFDPGTGQPLGTPRCSDGFQLSDLEVSAAGRVYVGDRTPALPGVRVYDAQTGDALASPPVDVCLPPFDMVLLDDAPLPAPPVPTPVHARLTAAPNPFNPQVTLRLSLPALPPTPPRLRIVDARGRLVALLAPRAPAEPAADGALSFQFLWDGTGADGSAVASGCYRAVPEGARAPATVVVLAR